MNFYWITATMMTIGCAVMAFYAEGFRVGMTFIVAWLMGLWYGWFYLRPGPRLVNAMKERDVE